MRNSQMHDDVDFIEHPEQWGRQCICLIQNAGSARRYGFMINHSGIEKFTVFIGNVFALAGEKIHEWDSLPKETYASAADVVAAGWSVD